MRVIDSHQKLKLPIQRTTMKSRKNKQTNKSGEKWMWQYVVQMSLTVSFRLRAKVLVLEQVSEVLLDTTKTWHVGGCFKADEQTSALWLQDACARLDCRLRRSWTYRQLEITIRIWFNKVGRWFRWLLTGRFIAAFNMFPSVFQNCFELYGRRSIILK